mgnify:CR=1 FL=1
MFKPYVLPYSRSMYQKNPFIKEVSYITLCATNHGIGTTIQEYNTTNYTLTEDPLFHISTNPCVIFIFLCFYSIWLGGFTKRQIYEYLNQEYTQ